MSSFDIKDIGKVYIPYDNSFILNLTDPGKEELLAGTREPCVAAERTTIVSAPYTCPVVFMGELYDREFIHVMFKGHYYRVMFSPHAIERDKLFSINGFWKEDKTKFSDHLVSSAEYDENLNSDKDDNIFFYGLSEADIKKAIEDKWDTELEFVITSYKVL